MSANIASVAYIAATILFILSLGGLSNPETSRRGNLYGMVGMTIAVLATVLGPRVTAAGIPWIIGSLAGGRRHRPVRGTQGADDADARAGRDHAQSRRPRCMPRRFCQLRRHVDRAGRRRKDHSRSRDLYRHPDRGGDVLRFRHRVRQTVRQDRRQADAAARASLAQPRGAARRDLVRRAVPEFARHRVGHGRRSR